MMNISERRTRNGVPNDLDDVQIDLTRLAFTDALRLNLLSGAAIIGGTIVRAIDRKDWNDWFFALLYLLLSLARITICLRYKSCNRAQSNPAIARNWLRRFCIATLLFLFIFALDTYYQYAARDWLAISLCTLGTFALEASFTARSGLPLWFSRSCSLILLGGLGISVAQLITHRLALSLGLLGILVCIQWISARTRFKILVEQLRGSYKLQSLAACEPLTGLANRRSFQQRVEAACAQSAPFAILYVDLDRFKVVNDTYGHGVGDELLKAVATRLKQIVRATDVVARFGGDEFAILQMPLAHTVDAKVLASRIVAELSHPFELDVHRVQIGASVGVRTAESPNEDPTSLLRAADQALYHVKRSGGGDLALAQY